MAYSNAIYYIDIYNGNDAARTALTSVIASNNGSGGVRMTKVGHGLVTGAIVVASLFTAYINGSWKITVIDPDSFDLDGAVWATTADVNGTITPNGGSSWADAWLTTAGTTASKIKAGDEIRICKTPDPVSLGLAQWTQDQNYIELATAPNIGVILKEATWVIATGGDVTTVLQKNGKSSSISTTRLTFDSSVQQNKKQAYCTTSETLDLSAYQDISFFIFPSAALTNNQYLRIALCSDTNGDVPVDWFEIPNITTSDSNTCVISKTGGGNLSNSIKSVAIYTGASVMTSLNSRYIEIDTIYATQTDGLNLNCVFGINGNTIGVDVGYFLPALFDGNKIYFDSLGTTTFLFPQKYAGETVNVLTYYRKTFVTPNIGNNGFISTVANGMLDNPIYYRLGYNTSTNEIDGETFLNSASGQGYGVRISHSYIKVNNINAYRFTYGVYISGLGANIEAINNLGGNINYGLISTGNKCSIGSIKACLFNKTSIVIYGKNISIGEIGCCMNGSYDAIQFGSNINTEELTIGKIYEITGGSNTILRFENIYKARIGWIGKIHKPNPGNSSGLFLYGITDFRIDKIDYIGEYQNASINQAGWCENAEIHNLENVSTIAMSNGKLDLINVGNMPIVSFPSTDNPIGRLNIYASDGTKISHFLLGNVLWQSDIKHSVSDIGSWRISINGGKKYVQELGKLAYLANKLVSIKMWVLTNGAYKIRLGVYERIIDGIMTDIYVSSNDSITEEWQEILLTFTPTNDGVSPIIIDIERIPTMGQYAYFAPISEITQE